MNPVDTNHPNDPPLLRVTDLRVVLHTSRGPAEALRGVGLALERGQTLGLIGESGCGKSMTAMALMGLLPPGARVSGSIRFKGQELVGLGDDAMCCLRGDRIGMIFQEPMTALNPLHTVGDQIAEPLRLHRRMPRAAARAEALRLLERVRLPQAAQRLDAYPHQLSGGQRQRVTIAMALACGPDLLIADEPTTALDVTIQGEILALIRELVDESGMALLMISHDLGVMARTVAHLLVMYGGTVVESGPTAEVFAHLAHPYTRGLFGARPRLGTPPVDGRKPRLATIPGRVPELVDLPAGCPFADRCAWVVDACRAAPPPPVPVGPGHAARCIRLEEVRAGNESVGAGPNASQLDGPAIARGERGPSDEAGPSSGSNSSSSSSALGRSSASSPPSASSSASATSASSPSSASGSASALGPASASSASSASSALNASNASNASSLPGSTSLADSSSSPGASSASSAPGAPGVSSPSTASRASNASDSRNEGRA